MDERIVKFRVGVMVLATFLIVGILIALFGKLPSWIGGEYSIFVWFPRTPGVANGTPVRKDGILIGRVTKVKMLKEGVVVRVEIAGEFKLERSDVCRLTASFLGDATLQFVGGAGHSEEYLQNGDYIVGNVAGNPLEMFDAFQGDIQETISVFTTAGREFRQAGQFVNRFLISNDEQLNRIVGKTELALDSFQRAAANIDSMFADEQMRADLKQGLANVPALLQETREAVAKLQAAASVAENVLNNVQGFTQPLGERGPAIVRNVDESIAQLDELLAQFTEFSKAVNNRESSLGRLLNDPELYQHVNAAAKNIEKLTLELRPIIYNAQVISDKLARHPGLPIRDALKPGPGIK